MGKGETALAKEGDLILVWFFARWNIFGAYTPDVIGFSNPAQYNRDIRGVVPDTRILCLL